MKRLVLWLTALVLGTGLTVANADENQGFFVGAGLGQFNVEVDNLDEAQDLVSDFDEEDTSWKIFAGWRFAPFFAVELDYIDFGGPSTQGTKFEVAGFAPYLVGTLPLGIFELSARVGYYFYDVDVNFDASQIEDVSQSDEDLVYGAGFGLLLFEHLNLKLEYEIIDLSDVDDANALWLTGAWRF